MIQVDFKAAGPDKQPTGKPIKTYDFTPHAGGVDFDDSKWEKIDPTTLDARRSTGRLCFNWYRINITIPPRVNDVDLAGATAVRSEEHTSELQSRFDLVCRLLLEKKKTSKA